LAANKDVFGPPVLLRTLAPTDLQQPFMGSLKMSAQDYPNPKYDYTQPPPLADLPSQTSLENVHRHHAVTSPTPVATVVDPHLILSLPKVEPPAPATHVARTLSAPVKLVPSGRRLPSKLANKLNDVVLQKLTKSDAKSLGVVFNELRQSSGEIRLDQEKFKELMIKNGFPAFAEPEVAKSLFLALDSNADGTVNKKEICAALMILSTDSLQNKIKMSFAIFDLNHDGFVSLEEMKTILSIFAKVNSDKSPEQDEKYIVQDCFSMFSGNSNKQLSYDQFAEVAASSELFQQFFTFEVFPAKH